MQTPDSAPATVIDRFRQRVAERPDQDLYIFVDGKGRDEASLTHQQLADAIDRRIAYFHEIGLKPGDRVLLVYPPSADFVIAFIACMAAGLIPAPVAPPNPLKPGSDLRAFEAIASDCASVAVLTEKSYLRTRQLGAAKDLFRRRGGAWSNLPWHRTDEGALSAARGSSGPSAPRVETLDEPAFLQYTSGSTSSPKGVMITHGNILHQLECNSQDLGLRTDSRSVVWVPHFHDFCLVSGILSALYGNGALYVMSPLTFLRRPHLWFELMSRVQATHTAAPDFAYRLAVRKTTPEQRQGWDLSHLKISMSAAEPIRASTVDAFLREFAASNLDPEAFCPAYGLAEHTVGVSVAGQRRVQVDRRLLELQRKVRVLGENDSGSADGNGSDPNSERLALFGCGPPSAEVDVRIVDPESHQELPEAQVGEIWVDSPSKALGYYGRPELSEQVFYARLAGEAGKNGRSYLRTGDLGFMLDGEVFVTGRLKDLIILRGRNLYPQDLEESVFTSHPLIRPGRAVAFSTNGMNGESAEREQIVVMTETQSKKVSSTDLDEIVRAVRTRVQHDHGISCDVLLVAPPGEILKTTSGKLRRQACRQAYLDGSLERRLLRHDVKASRVAPSAS